MLQPRYTPYETTYEYRIAYISNRTFCVIQIFNGENRTISVEGSHKKKSFDLTMTAISKDPRIAKTTSHVLEYNRLYVSNRILSVL